MMINGFTMHLEPQYSIVPEGGCRESGGGRCGIDVFIPGYATPFSGLMFLGGGALAGDVKAATGVAASSGVATNTGMRAAKWAEDRGSMGCRYVQARRIDVDDRAHQLPPRVQLRFQGR